MKEGSLLIVVSAEARQQLVYWAKKHHRSSLRDEAAYLVEWALDELDRREVEEPDEAA